MKCLTECHINNFVYDNLSVSSLWYGIRNIEGNNNN